MAQVWPGEPILGAAGHACDDDGGDGDARNDAHDFNQEKEYDDDLDNNFSDAGDAHDDLVATGGAIVDSAAADHDDGDDGLTAMAVLTTMVVKSVVTMMLFITLTRVHCIGESSEVATFSVSVIMPGALHGCQNWGNTAVVDRKTALSTRVECCCTLYRSAVYISARFRAIDDECLSGPLFKC